MFAVVILGNNDIW